MTATVHPAAGAFTAAFNQEPAEHDGATPFTLHLRFHEAPKPLGFRRIRDHVLSVAGGQITRVARLVTTGAGRNRDWEVTVKPTSNEAVVVAVQGTEACDDPHAVCTPDERPLEGGVQVRIPGPAVLSIAGARVEEADGATLEFVVTLSRRRFATTTVDYATADGEAAAGSDYEASAGTLTFRALQTEQTISVTVLDDEEDEDEETLTVTLSNPAPSSYVHLDEEASTATGTITNADAMPRAWLARFGRTVAEQVLDAVEGRLRAARQPGVSARLAGQALPAWRFGEEAHGGAPEGGAGAAALRHAEQARARERVAALSRWLRGAGADGEGRQQSARALTAHDLLTGTSFSLTAATDGGGTAALWAGGAVSRFDGREGALALDGEVASAMLGADWTRGPWTAGLLVSHARGEGGYRGEAGAGAVSSTLTGLYPYGRYAVSPRLELWGVAGYGAGALTLEPDGGRALRTDLDLLTAAVGLRGVAVAAPAAGGVELAVTADALGVRTTSAALRGAAGNLAGAQADVTRLRLGLEGTWRGLDLGAGTLAPRLELGLRHDGGDAETGLGVDLGAGLGWSDPARGLAADLSARGLLAHEAGGFRDEGLAGALEWRPRQGTDRGPSLTLRHTLGGASRGGVDALLGRGTLEGLAANDDEDAPAHRRLEIKLGYGLSALGDRFTLTPQAGAGFSNAGRDYSLGARLVPRGSGRIGALEIGLEARRRERANDDAPPEHDVGLRIGARW